MHHSYHPWLQPQESHWLPDFIHNHALEMGYLAWGSYITQGRGVLMAEINHESAENPYYLSYLNTSEARKQLDHLEFSASERYPILENIQQYCPETELIFLTLGRGEVLVTRLKNLDMSPIQAYTLVRHRWDEFSLNQPNPLIMPLSIQD